MEEDSLRSLAAGIALMSQVLETSKKNRFRISTHSFYAKKTREIQAVIRREFLLVKDAYSTPAQAGVAAEFQALDPLIEALVTETPDDIGKAMALVDAVEFKLNSDLPVAIAKALRGGRPASGATYLPDDLIDKRHRVLAHVLWEVNQTYASQCYNSCAAMTRRLVESLIVEAYRKLGIEDRIKEGGDYVDFSKLIARAAGEEKLALTRNTKRVFPQLKFFGDLGVHNRNALVRKDDMDKVHEAARSAIDELGALV